MTFAYACYSNTGKRSNNEDAYSIQQHENVLIAVVADGLGGHLNGEVASSIAAENIPQSLLGREFDEDTLGYAILDAHKSICETQSSAYTTLAALWINGNKAIAAHVGDSRIYHFRDKKILYQSEDHSIVQVAISLGKLPTDACRYHKDRNQVYNVLGNENERPIVDIHSLDILPGDRFLLCSDGFWEPITEEKMLKDIFSTSAPRIFMDQMIAQILEADNPKQDNHTAIIIFADS